MATFKELVLYRLINIALFYLGWVYIVMSAAKHFPFRGVVGGLFIIFFNLILSKKWVKELILLICVAAVGFVIDSLYTGFHLVTYTSPSSISSYCAPFWIVVLYALFGTTINHSLKWIKHMPIVAMIFGAIGGTLSYFVASKLGALTFSNQTVALSIIAIVWLILLPLLCFLSNALDRTFGKA